ncbi:uncharacterized protein K02A2.6-like [Eupeodes corollae]|uniref:uncharacterized protein K02A2.6-like n=1 Tax=Eupeodes corollae TaxID=290404 RepID=UPI00248F790F|nr:uncharacterized protein K02A2.6-like [Eupeodes corollae]
MATFGELPKFHHEVNDFKIFQDKLEQFFIGNNIEEKSVEQRRALLLISLHDDTLKLLTDLVSPDTVATKAYKVLMKKLGDLFKPAFSAFAERLKFYEAKKSPHETLQQWAARVRSLAANCKFDTNLNMILRDKFIMGLEKGPEKDKLFLESVTKLTFEKAMEISLAVECIRHQYEAPHMEIKREQEVFRLKSQHRKPPASSSSSPKQQHQWRSNSSAAQAHSMQHPACTRCGLKNHIAENCRFKGYTCQKCGEKGHLKKMCKNHRSNNSDNKVKEDNLLKPITTTVNMNGIDLKMEIDSGASISAISDDVYRNLFSDLKVVESNISLKAYDGAIIKPIGVCKVNVQFKNVTKLVDIFIIKNGGPPILGRSWMKAFNIGFENIKISQQNLDNDLVQVLDNYKDLFDGSLGTFKYGTVSLKLKEGATPKFFRPRKLPFAIKDKVETEIDRLVGLGVLQYVNYSEWGTPIVPIMKKDGTVRICGDYKVTLNPHLKPYQYPFPRIEELFAKLHGGQEFSKIDLAMAYQQLLLDKDSRKLTTISTTKGLFEYTRMVFGVAPAPAIFQEKIESLLSGIDGVTIFMDDLLTTGKDKKEHLKTLSLVLSKLQEAGLKVSPHKCEFFKESVCYLGHVIDKHGLRKDPAKVKAVMNLSEPKNITELQSFLGVINFYRQFMPNLATTAAPLYENMSNKFIWETLQKEAFESVKKIMSSDICLAHFDPSEEVKLIVDASPVGLGAVLVHQYADGKELPISFASKRLSKTEMKYSQIEREALAIVFGVNKFHQYLFGKKFV